MKFPSTRWADAFLQVAGSDTAEGLSVLKSFAGASQETFKPRISGHKKAKEAVTLLGRALLSCGITETTPGIRAAEATLYLLILRGAFPYLGALIDTIEREHNQRSGILEVRLESASPATESFMETLRRTLKEKNGAKEVIITQTINPDLIAGYRVCIGSNRQDFSVKGQLKQLQKALGKKG